MRFARIVFVTAGIWGIAVLTPLYWLVDITGRRYGPPGDYPHFFYGFLGVALAWHLAFLMIRASPARFRALMIPCTIEKFGDVATTVTLYALGRIAWVDAQAAIPDGLLGVLFVVAFLKHATSDERAIRRHDFHSDSVRGACFGASQGHSRGQFRRE